MFKYQVLCLALMVGAVVAYECSSDETYDWPDEETLDCRHYFHCEKGQSSRRACFIFFRKFNPDTLKCDWFWNVNCYTSPTAPTTEPPSDWSTDSTGSISASSESGISTESDALQE